MNFIHDCLKASDEVNKIIYTFSHQSLCKEQNKGFGGDISKNIDIISEGIFIKYLQKYGQIYSEESGFVGKKSKTKIIIDPLDGSDNFVSNIPYFGSSVALVQNGVTKQSFIVNYANGDVFYKNKNKLKKGNLFYHEFKNQKINKHSSVGFFERSYDNVKMVKMLKKLNLKFRSLGALALSLAYARQVDFLLFCGKARKFDIVAGLHMNEDLFIKKDKNFLFISKDKQKFDKILKKILKAG